MPQERRELSSDAMLARLEMLGKKIKRAGALADRVNEILDDAACDLDDLRGMVGRAVAAPLAGPVSAPGQTGLGRRRRRRQQGPSPGVGSAALVAQPDGSAVAKIDGTDIPLPPFVAALLEILMADSDVAADKFVGWKSPATIQFGLNQRTKREHSKAAVKELVLRLRDLLQRHGLDRFLVESNRQLGYRFALRRTVGLKTDRDNH